VRLVFQGGRTAEFPAAHPDRAHFVRVAEYSIRYQQPVGVVLDGAGGLLDLHHTDEVTVHRVRQDERDPNRLVVEFWGFCAICYLVRDHPDFERIRTTLEEAAASGRRVWFANYSWPDQSDDEVWNRIMDVRPVPVAAPGHGEPAGSAGTAGPDRNGVPEQAPATESPAASVE
jgi:hypothetical protein